MKKIIRNLLFITVIISALLLSSCGGLEKHSEAGLVFYLPEDMEKINVAYADLCFANRDTEFFVYYYSRDELLTKNFIDKDSTSEEYLTDFIAFNGYTNVDRTYDAEKNIATAKYIYEDENTFYFDFVIRNYYVLAHVTMHCDADLRGEYERIFDDWAEKIYLEEME